MKKLSIKSIIEFRRKSYKSKKTFVAALKNEKPKAATEGGGDYWTSCLSAISNSFKRNDLQPVIDRRAELEEKYQKTASLSLRPRYQRNIDILKKYEGYDLKKWRPHKVHFLRKLKEHAILHIDAFPIQATPHHVFVFQHQGVEEVGAIWFVAKLNGFRKAELGMFSDLLYQYLQLHFSKDHPVNSKYCIAVDVFNKLEVRYSELENEAVPFILHSTLAEIKSLL